MKVSHTLLAAAVGGVLAAGVIGCGSSNAAGAGPNMPSAGAKHACKGQNDCKGQGGCKA